ncbi:YheT family hydrolase [Flectobacillus major]|uniref:YheT family hydrolase n=1 Tax=Flectobacillus major TaxID=103 RepID=UPI00042856A8|nr:alpha/beta fold hydrolase [Flectobacillus major]
MPVIKHSDYQPPFWLPNGHFQTIYPSLFRKVEGINYQRVRLDTPDHDFLDLDWSKVPPLSAHKSNPLLILCHGLEGDSTRQYITGMVSLFNHKGFDCLAWNYRSCSGEVNKQLRFYHSGATDDLDFVVRYASKTYTEIYLMGFSLGGNLTLKYLGEKGENLAPEIKKAVTFSVPLHLSGSSSKMESWQDWVYTRRFNKTLTKKILEKAKYFPEKINTSNISKIRTLRDFDNYYTSQLHGFKDAEDYYHRNSSVFFIDKIAIPTLIVNAQNDPFLSKECFPFDKAKSLEKVYFQAPAKGGHCGFLQKKFEGILWSENRAFDFLTHS